MAKPVPSDPIVTKWLLWRAKTIVVIIQRQVRSIALGYAIT